MFLYSYVYVHRVSLVKVSSGVRAWKMYRLLSREFLQRVMLLHTLWIIRNVTWRTSVYWTGNVQFMME